MTPPPPLDYESPQPREPQPVRLARTLASASPIIAIASPILAVILAIAGHETLGPSPLVGALFLTLITAGILTGVIALATSRNIPDALFRFLAGLAVYVLCAFALAFYAVAHR